MKSTANTVVAVIVTFIVTLVLQVMSSYFTRDFGSIVVGSAVDIGATSYVPVDIANFEATPLDDVRVVVPSAAAAGHIITSKPIQIIAVSNIVVAGGHSMVSVSAIPPRTRTRLMVPVAKGSAESVTAVNAADRKVVVSTDGNVGSPVVPILWHALTSALILLVVLSISEYWSHQRWEEHKKRRQEFDAQITTINAKMDRADAKLRESDLTNARLRVLMGARLPTTDAS